MQSRRMFGAGAAAAAVAAFLGLAMARTSAQQPAGTVAVDADDLGGVVTGPKGPEAGVWVIAETTDLPTKFVRIVVTDDRGRYLVPDLPKASYSVWVRGYGLVDSAKVTSRARQGAEPDRGRRARRASRGAVLPGGLLVLAAPGSGQERVPRHRAERERHLSGLKSQGEWIRPDKSGACLSCHQLGSKGTRELLPALGHFDSSVDAWQRRLQSGQAGADMMRRAQSARAEARAGAVRGLDRSHCCRRSAAGAAAPAGDRAQRRHHRVGLGASEGISARRGLDRSPQSDTEPQRPDLRVARAERRLPAGARSGEQPGQPGASSPCAIRIRQPAAGPMMLQPSPYWGREVAVEQQEQRPQPDVRRARARLWITSAVRPAGQPGLLQAGIESSVGEAVSDRPRPAGISPCTTRRPASSRTSAPVSARIT